MYRNSLRYRRLSVKYYLRGPAKQLGGKLLPRKSGTVLLTATTLPHCTATTLPLDYDMAFIAAKLRHGIYLRHSLFCER